MKLSATKYAQLLLALAEDDRISDETVGSFLTFLRKNRQERLLPRILLAAEELRKKALGIREVTLTVPVKTETKEVARALADALEAKEIIVHEKVDRAVLGGARLEIDDLVYDFTLRRQLQTLKSQLLS